MVHLAAEDGIETGAPVRRNRLRLLALAAAGLPPLVIARLIWSRGVNVPYGDEWSLVPLVLHLHGGTLSWAEMWAPHNEHRIAAVRLLVITLLPFDGFNLVTSMFVAFGFAIGAVLLFLRALQLTFPAERLAVVGVLAFSTSTLVFSVVQYETWLNALVWGDWRLQASSGARRAVALTASLVTIALAIGHLDASRHMRRKLELHQAGLEFCRQELLFFDSAPPAVFAYLHPSDPALVPRYAALLQKAGLGPFRQIPRPD
jgi:hypothetical protein